MPRRVPGRSVEELAALLAAERRRSAELEHGLVERERALADARREAEERAEQQTVTAEVLRVISRAPTDLQAVLDAIVRSAARLSASDGGVVFRVEGDTFRSVARLVGEPVSLAAPGEANLLSREDGLTGRAMVDGEVVHVHDLTAVPIDQAPAPYPRSRGIRTMLCVPLLGQGTGVGAIGALGVSRLEVRPYTEREIALVKTFADQAVIAIENARLFQELADKSRQLEEASRHKSEFLASMSHELRTPLNAVIGFTEVLLEKYFGEINAKQEEYLRDVLSSGQHLLALINDILNLSKVEAGRMELELSTFALEPALEAGLVMVRERAAGKGIALSLQVTEDAGRVEADERKVKQVLFNLLTNAVKFTPEGGAVSVSARRADGWVEVAVQDTGVGIAPEEQDRVFEEFAQARSASRPSEGTGLGLTLCKRFVELHGGTIAVASQVGRGSTFTFSLPVRQPEPSASPSR
jgi:signal transduction histidine kinase